MKFEKRDYSDSEDLQALAEKIAEVVPELAYARQAKYKVFYSSSEPEHIGGKCRRLDGAVRFQTGMDYFILIHRAPFVASNIFQKVRMLVHEEYHIFKDRNTWLVRRHAGDFCEIAEHDALSYRLALTAMAALELKVPDEEEALKYARMS